MTTEIIRSFVPFFEERLQDLFLADPTLNKAIKRFYLGVPLDVQVSEFPYLVIFTTDDVPESEGTGIQNYVYSIRLILTTNNLDNPVVKGKKATVKSYRFIQDTIAVLRHVLEQNRNLGGLEVDLGGGIMEKITTLIITSAAYGEDDRGSNVDNVGELLFELFTQKDDC